MLVNPVFLYLRFMKLAIINGPNLNLLGKRQPEIYGTQSFESYFKTLVELYPDVELNYFQSNWEGAIIDKLQEFGFSSDGIILNAGAYTHTSIALADCVSAISTPVVEVHISNIHERESFRQHSYISAEASKIIIGQGLDGYRQAIDFLIKK